MELGDEAMNNEYLSPNEIVELHQIIELKTTSMTLSKLMEGVVFDQELKALLEKDVQQSITAIKEIDNIMAKAQALK